MLSILISLLGRSLILPPWASCSRHTIPPPDPPIKRSPHCTALNTMHWNTCNHWGLVSPYKHNRKSCLFLLKLMIFRSYGPSDMVILIYVHPYARRSNKEIQGSQCLRLKTPTFKHLVEVQVRQIIMIQITTSSYTRFPIICQSTDKRAWVMYVWREIAPALARYLVNANWPSYPASNRDRWGRIAGLQRCNTYTCAFTVKLGQR